MATRQFNIQEIKFLSLCAKITKKKQTASRHSSVKHSNKGIILVFSRVQVLAENILLLFI